MNLIYHCFRIKASPENIREALTTAEGLAGWWTRNVECEGTVGSVCTFRFSSGAFNRMKIVSLEPGRIEWECIDGHVEWIGTRVLFELRPEGEGVKVCFSHSGWKELTEWVGECSFHWANYFVSLQNYCETGQGTPNQG